MLPVLPGKITKGVCGKRLSASVRQTGTLGHICPTTVARLTRSALTPTSLDVMPPFATTNAGVTVRRPTRLCTPSLILTLRSSALSLGSFSSVNRVRLV